jgi:hypothetical protein
MVAKHGKRFYIKMKIPEPLQVTIDPNNSNIVFADMWAGRQGPGKMVHGMEKKVDCLNQQMAVLHGKRSRKACLQLNKVWEELVFCMRPSDSKRMYATVDAGREGGIYRSDDAGESWTRIQTDNRYWGRASDFAEVKVIRKMQTLFILQILLPGKVLMEEKHSMHFVVHRWR